MKTTFIKNEERDRKWYLVDAKDIALGRLSTQVANILMGKNKPEYTPHIDNGDFVVVINAEKVKVSGNKENYLEYATYSGYPGGRRVYPYKDVKAKRPEFIIKEAVRRMLPKTTLARTMLKKLKINAGPEHKQKAQNPVKITLKV